MSLIPTSKGDGKGQTGLVPVVAKQFFKATAGTVKKEPGGYLIDNNGTMHEISEFAAESLLGNVEPEMTTGDKKLPVWKVDPGGDGFTSTTYHYHVNSCVYDATKKYLEALGLGTLTPGDKYWFEQHPRVNSDGVNKANVLAVAHGLAVPWGKGITKVYVPKMSTLGDQLKEFAQALGINPLALQTYGASNDDFIDAMGFDPNGPEAKMIRDTLRFEFVDEPPMVPCVVMMSSSAQVKKSGGTTVKGQWSSTTSGVGHADFIGPRDSVPKNWKIAFQLGPLAEYNEVNGVSINRYSNAKVAFPGESKETSSVQRKFSIWSSRVGGKTLNAWDNARRTAKNAATSAVHRQEVTPATTVQSSKSTSTAVRRSTACGKCGGMVVELDGTAYCLACDWFEVEEEVQAGISEVCPMCYSALANGICIDSSCGFNARLHVESTYFICSKHNVPLYFYQAGGGYNYVCPECLFVQRRELLTYVKNEETHPKGLITQIREFNDGKKPADTQAAGKDNGADNAIAEEIDTGGDGDGNDTEATAV